MDRDKTAKGDPKEIRQFARDVKIDLRHLRTELGFAPNDPCSRESFVLTVADTAASCLRGAPIAIKA